MFLLAIKDRETLEIYYEDSDEKIYLDFKWRNDPIKHWEFEDQIIKWRDLRLEDRLKTRSETGFEIVEPYELVLLPKFMNDMRRLPVPRYGIIQLWAESNFTKDINTPPSGPVSLTRLR